MTTEEIQRRVDVLSKAMLAKAVSQPAVSLSIESNKSDCSVALSWPGKSYRDYKFLRGTPEQALDAADAYVADLPSPEQARMRDFMHSLSETIELGKKIDTEVDFVNPLIVLMERLSKNALTHAEA
jgi:hypothetical protein